MIKQVLPKQNELLQLTVDSLEDRMMLSSVQIYAAGQTGTESLELKINDVVAATFDNIGGDVANRQFQELTFTTDQSITASEVRLQFINDLYRAEDGFDRNVVIDRIVVDGRIYETESPSTFSTGVWRDGSVTDPGFLETETLNINGSFFYSNNGGSDPETRNGTILRIEAQGTTGDERLQVRIDGEVVETFDVTTDLESYFFVSDEGIVVEQVQLEFINDLYDPEAGIDRNLIVQQIQLVDRTTLERQRFFTDSETTFSTGTWRAEDGVVEGFGRGDTLHSNGFLQYSQSETSTGSLAIDTSYGDSGFAGFPASSFNSLMAISPSGEAIGFYATGDIVLGGSTIQALLFDSDGKILNEIAIASGGRQQPRIYTVDFGADGSILTSMDFPRLSSSRIVKLTPEGNYDTSFSDDGFLDLGELYPGEATVAPDGSVYFAGRVRDTSQFTMTKFDSQGNVVTSFGTNGSVDLNFGTSVVGVEPTSDGGAYAVINDAVSGFQTITKLTADGQRDLSFGNNGDVFRSPQESNVASRLLVDSQDRLLLTTIFEGRTELVRITSGGEIDNGFGESGTVVLSPGFQIAEIDAQGRILGYSNVESESGVTAGIFRLEESGNFDVTFDDDGIFVTATELALNDSNQRINNVRVGDDGAIYAKSASGIRKYIIV